MRNRAGSARPVRDDKKFSLAQEQERHDTPLRPGEIPNNLETNYHPVTVHGRASGH